MSDGEQLQRVGDELVAVCACFGPQIALQHVEPIELLVAVREGTFDAASQPHLEGREVRLAVALALGSADCSTDASAAHLHLVLPPGYPAHAAARVEAATCSALGRAGEAAAAARLQTLAHQAAAGAAQGGGQECLYQLLQALLEEASTAAEAAEAAAAARQAAAAAPPAAAEAAQQQQLALLKLDHMRDRASYSRTLKGWARELGLAGRLLFCSGGGGGGSSSVAPPIILVLLSGAAPALKEFLFRLRTRNVDVDSKGRPCRERMMAEIAVEQRQPELTPGDPPPAHGSSASGGGGGGSEGGSGSGAAPDAACFGNAFREEELGVPALAALLARCGLSQHWREATGLSTPPPGACL